MKATLIATMVAVLGFASTVAWAADVPSGAPQARPAAEASAASPAVAPKGPAAEPRQSRSPGDPHERLMRELESLRQGPSLLCACVPEKTKA